MSARKYLLLGGPQHGRYVVHRGGPLYVGIADQTAADFRQDDPEPTDHISFKKTIYYPHRTALRVIGGTDNLAVRARIMRHESLSAEEADMKYIQLVFSLCPEVEFERWSY